MKKYFSILFLLSAGYAHAGISTVSTKLQGIDLSVNATLTLEDSRHQFMIANLPPSQWPFDNIYAQDRISLKYEESVRTFYSSPWSIEVQCTVQKFDETGVMTTEQCTLSIDYNPAAGTKYLDRGTYVTNGAHKLIIIVDNIVLTGISPVPSDVLLEAEIETERFWFYEFAPPPVTSHSLNTTDNTLQFTWNYLEGAEEYDIEWLFVSFYDASAQLNPDFRKSTRVTLSDNHYKINLVYDKGFIVYRVRGAGRMGQDFGQRAEGLWSNENTTALITSATNPLGNLGTLDDNRNWQYTASYAEEGKRKEVLSFFDGSLRNRQAVTLSNTDNAALISETMYDYEGRAAVQTLPAPDMLRSNRMKFYTDYSLNLNTTNTLYSREDFDRDDLYTAVGATCKVTPTPGMKTFEGASNYYSPDNSFQEGFNAAIPDAQLYPFTQTTYGNDGRISRQSGVGKDHTIGSEHETKYFYATPTQNKLDQLFGNEVGDHSHYSMKVVQDANKQVSVSYEDLSGKVVATGLSGNAPANLDALSSLSEVTVTDDFSNLNEYVKKDEAWYIRDKIMVTYPNVIYNFHYVMTPAQFQAMCISSTTVSCVYDVTITIWDDECNKVFGSPITYMMNSTGIDVTFPVTFPKVGTFSIEKKISLNKDALETAVAGFKNLLLLGTTTCIPTLEELIDDYGATVEQDECECESFCMNHYSEILDANGMPLYTSADACITAECSTIIASSNCGAILKNLKADLSPGGQYFENQHFGDPPPASPDNSWLIAYLWANGMFEPAWTSANFRDANNVLITSWEGLRSNWQPTFVTQSFASPVTVTVNNYQRTGSSLVEFHPEYCAYGWCISTQSSTLFDVSVNRIQTYADATTTPGGAPYIDISQSPVGLNLLNADPYFSGLGAADKTTMYNSSNNTGFLTDNDSSGTDMWVQAGNESQLNYNCINCNEHWQIFRAFYMSRKLKLMHERKEDQVCYSPCDASTPPDNVADGCWNPNLVFPPPTQHELAQAFIDQSTFNFYINVPDYFHLLNGMTSSAPDPNTWGSTVTAATDFCKTPAYAIIDVVSIPFECFMPMMTITVSADNCTACIPPGSFSTEITGGNCCLNVTDVPSFVAGVVQAINNHISSPYDFTAAIDPADNSKFIVYAPASLGTIPNNLFELNISGCVQTTTATVTMNGGTDPENCDPLKNCFCAVLDQLVEEYNSPGFPQTQGSDYNTVTTYIAFAFNSAFDLPTGTTPTVTPLQIEHWLGNCCKTQNQDPETPILVDTDPCPNYPYNNPGIEPVPAAIDCDTPEPCEEDAFIIANYWALFAYNQLVANATQAFIDEYKKKCFSAPFSETLTAEHPEKEHHYTLYYYDQAGNLVRTVPPAGVDLLDANEILAVQNHRKNPSAFPSPTYPAHAMVTNYQYNTLDQVTHQSTPDAGNTSFTYDNVGRIIKSQNQKQFALSAGVTIFSYTEYDGQGRIMEVGEKLTSSILDPEGNPVTTVQKSQVTKTFYDSPKYTLPGFTQDNLRQRVASITIEHGEDDNDDFTYDHATHYSYDIHGNVSTLVQENPSLGNLSQQQYKTISYEYDLVSGNVNAVHYQDGKPDQFHHKYQYDADNRITRVFTSKDRITWDNDAKYFYYLHGPLARTEIGDRSVQALDYAYTIQGWIKGVNSNQLAAANSANLLASNPDIGRDAVNDDGVTGTYISGLPNLHKQFAADAFGYTLGYFDNGAGKKDYKPITSLPKYLVTDIADPGSRNIPGNDLFNGNIKQMATALMQPNPLVLPTLMPLISNDYRYDQLNRLTTAQAFISSANYNYTTATHNGDYDNTFSYDANGNIATQVRNGTTAPALAMDNLSYFYYDNANGFYNPSGGTPLNATNKLAYVSDGPISPYTDDIEDQTLLTKPLISGVSRNYFYDPIGNLVQDLQEEIANIEWTVYGKVKKVTRSANNHSKPDLEFAYDASGNRIMKLVKPRTAGVLSTEAQWTYTYYVRDAQGNILATYDKKYLNTGAPNDFQEALTLSENDIYGSARLGTYSRQNNTIALNSFTSGGFNADNTFIKTNEVQLNIFVPSNNFVRVLGEKIYECTNHLGNVLTTIADRKLPVQGVPTTVVAFYLPDVVSTTDYSAFGSPLPGRTFSSPSYRYGYNGQEKDDEVTGSSGTHYTATFWEYDARTARRWNVDPEFTQIPQWSPYVVLGDNPIINVDKKGDWWDVFLDIAFIAYDAGEALYQYGTTGQVSVTTAAAFSADVTAAFTPFVTGAGLGVRAGSAGTKAALLTSKAPNIFAKGIKFAGFGGNVIAKEGKVTKVLGSYSLSSLKGLKEKAITNNAFKQLTNLKAEIGKGLEILNVSSKEWADAGKAAFEKYNIPFLDEAVQRGETVRFTTDPVAFKKISNWAETTFGKEIKYFEDKFGQPIDKLLNGGAELDLSKLK